MERSRKKSSSPPPHKGYIDINDDAIANDYPPKKKHMNFYFLTLAMRLTLVTWSSLVIPKAEERKMIVLTDHIYKEMELNLIRCKKIPKRPGVYWRDLPDKNVSHVADSTLSWAIERMFMNPGLFGISYIE